MTGSEPHDGFCRLHGSSLLFAGIDQLRRFLLPAVILLGYLLLSGDTSRRWELWLVFFLVPAFVVEALRLLTFRYRFTEDKLIVRRWLIVRKERHIPLGRIQNIDLVQNPLHRALKVAEVRLETAGGQEAEAVFRVLSLDAVEEMRRRVFAPGGHDAGAATTAEAGPAELVARPLPARAADEGWAGRGDARAHLGAPSPSGKLLLHVPPLELVKLGLVSNRGTAILAGVLYLLWELDPLRETRMERLFASRDQALEGQPSILLLGGALLAVLVLLRVLSVAWVLYRFYDYRVERIGEDLRVSGGLITRISATIPRRRIQLVSVQQSRLLRAIGRASIRIETAGGIGLGVEDREQAIASRRWFVPVIQDTRVPALMRELRPDLDWEQVAWQPLAPTARRRMLTRTLLAAALLGGLATALWRPWGALSLLVFVPVAIHHAVRWAAYTRYARLEDGLMFRSGVWTRSVTASFFSKMQVITQLQSPLDRRHDHARLRIDTAGAGPAGHRLDVPYLERSVAETLREHLFQMIGQTRFRWS